MSSDDLLKPVKDLKIVDLNWLKPNNYNLKLLTQSILSNGWMLPIVARPDGTIIDGFHRYTAAGREPLKSKPGGEVPVVTVEHEDDAGNAFGTIAQPVPVGRIGRSQ